MAYFGALSIQLKYLQASGLSCSWPLYNYNFAQGSVKGFLHIEGFWRDSCILRGSEGFFVCWGILKGFFLRVSCIFCIFRGSEEFFVYSGDLKGFLFWFQWQWKDTRGSIRGRNRTHAQCVRRSSPHWACSIITGSPLTERFWREILTNNRGSSVKLVINVLHWKLLYKLTRFFTQVK